MAAAHPRDACQAVPDTSLRTPRYGPLVTRRYGDLLRSLARSPSLEPGAPADGSSHRARCAQPGVAEYRPIVVPTPRYGAKHLVTRHLVTPIRVYSCTRRNGRTVMCSQTCPVT